MTFTKVEMNALYETFAPEEHQVREGYKKDGFQYWYVYVKRGAIQLRLDRLFPGEWESEIIGEPRQYERGIITVTMSLTIRGMVRTYNGSNKDKPIKSGSDILDYENTEKSAMTDAFKRVASMWGIGLYLEGWIIRTPVNGTSEQALKIVKQWLEKTPAHDTDTGEIVEGDEDEIQSEDMQDVTPPPPATNGNGKIAPAPKPNIETAVVKVTVKKDKKKGNPYLLCATAAEQNVTAFTRSKFIEKGYTEAEDWTVAGTEYTPVLPIPVTLRFLPDTGYYELLDVAPATMEAATEPDPKAVA